jgi:peptide/nickel transport system permease protein
MLRLTARRLAQAVPVLFMVSVLSFLLLRAAPGNPAQEQAGLNGTPKVIAEISRQLGLNKPLPVQYWIWLRGIFHGSLGVSYSTGEPVTSVLAPRVPVTAEVGVVALVITVLVGVPLGVWSALAKDHFVDHASRAFSLLLIAVPSFVLALFFVLVFGWWFRGLLPYQGFTPLSQSLGSNLSHVILPAICLAAGPVGIVARVTRVSLLEVLSSDYVVAAHALGVSRFEVVWKDALRNALMPVLTVLGLVAGYLISGSVVVETVFGLPGLGALLVSAFNDRDYTVAISVMMIGAATFVVANLAVDLLYGLVNPKVRAGWVTCPEA